MNDDEIHKILENKYSDCEIEVLNVREWELDKLIEFITDDIIIQKPYNVQGFKNMFRLMIKFDEVPDKIYYLNECSGDDLKRINAGLLKFAWKTNFRIRLFDTVDPERDIINS